MLSVAVVPEAGRGVGHEFALIEAELPAPVVLRGEHASAAGRYHHLLARDDEQESMFEHRRTF